MPTEGSIWDKVGKVEPKSGDQSKTPTWTKPDWLRMWERRRPFVDAIAVALWVYLIVKAFVGDIDREIADVLGSESLADYRIFFFLALLALVALLVRRPRYLLFALAYITFFPVVVLVWKLPIAILKSKSWVAFLTTANVVSTVVSNLRYAILAITAGAFATLAVVASSSDAVLMLGASTIAVLLAVSYWRTIKFSLKPSHFLQVQERAIKRVVAGDGFHRLTALNEDLRRDEVKRFDEEQQQSFVNNLGASVLAHRCLLLWAYELDRYRRSGVPILFGLLAYLGLLIQTVVGLTLINYAVYKVDAAAFSFSDSPSVWVFARYSFSSLYGNEIGALQAQSDLANILALLGFFAGVILVAGGAFSVVMSVRAKTNEAAAQETIEHIKAQGRQLAEAHREEYEISVDEAARRLQNLQYALMGVVDYVTSRVPADFGWAASDDPRSGSSAGGA